MILGNTSALEVFKKSFVLGANDLAYLVVKVQAL